MKPLRSFNKQFLELQVRDVTHRHSDWESNHQGHQGLGRTAGGEIFESVLCISITNQVLLIIAASNIWNYTAVVDDKESSLLVGFFCFRSSLCLH